MVVLSELFEMICKSSDAEELWVRNRASSLETFLRLGKNISAKPQKEK